jgi:hypothetical protein
MVVDCDNDADCAVVAGSPDVSVVFDLEDNEEGLRSIT